MIVRIYPSCGFVADLLGYRFMWGFKKLCDCKGLVKGGDRVER